MTHALDIIAADHNLIEPLPGRTSTRRHWMALLAIVLFAAGFRGLLLDRPFSHNPEGVGCFYGQLARNYLRYPIRQTKGLPVMTIGRVEGVRPTFYAHHPPLVPLLIAGSYALFGQGDWQTRLPTACFTVGCVALLYWLLARRRRPRAGIFAAALFAAAPITLFYGGQPDVVGTQLNFFILLSIAAYTHFLARPGVRRLVLLCLAFLPAALTDWPAFFLVPVLLGHFLWTCRVRARTAEPLPQDGATEAGRQERSWRPVLLMLIFCVVATVYFAGAYLHIVFGADQPFDWIIKEVQRRSNAGEGDRGAVTAAMWLAGIWRHNLARHTIILLLLGFSWLVVFGFRRGVNPATTIVRLALAWAALHILVGRQGVYVHDWWWWPLTPGLALAAGLLVDELTDAVSIERRRTVSAALAVLYVAFATWTSATILPRYFSDRYTRGGVSFSTREFGEAIRLAAPNNRNAPVLIAYNDTYDLPLWYYGDRPLRFNVWDPYTLEQTIHATANTLPFGYEQADWPVSPAGFVFPREFIPSAAGFVDYLRAHYPRRETRRFLIFDLAHPLVGTTRPSTSPGALDQGIP